MSYIVFARKYRPTNFDEITGQSHITTTLKNAITKSRVAHAYLFAGPRGVGKTTTARILAKALNCEEGPAPKPCDKCQSCLEIAAGSSLDIFEIDGASNRGIDEIRSLRENAKFTPTRSRFKVYIIDEVHMLSNEAFNALLKTLEEPPQHVKFIFATTHAHKVPPTILSRCQRFDFKRIPAAEIIDNLKKIVKEEKIAASDDALGLIARYGDGSMRDAQVILDQLASFTAGRLAVEDVERVLGTVDDETLFDLSGAICDGDPKAALKVIDAVTNDGKEASQTVRSLIEHFRNISIAKVSGELDGLIDAGKDKIERYREESKKFTIEQILYVIYTLSNTIDFMRKTDMARIPFEAAMVKLTRSSGAEAIADIVKRVEALEGRSIPAAAPERRSPENRPEAAVGQFQPRPQFQAQPKSQAQAQPKSQPQPSEAQAFSLDEILSSWTKVISCIRNKKISIASYLQEGDPVSLEGGILTLGFAKEFQFHKEVLESADNRKIIEDAIKEVFGWELRVLLAVTGPEERSVRRPGSPAESGTGREGQVEAASSEVGSVPGETDPIVKRAVEMFDGKLVAGPNGKGRAA